MSLASWPASSIWRCPRHRFQPLCGVSCSGNEGPHRCVILQSAFVLTHRAPGAWETVLCLPKISYIALPYSHDIQKCSARAQVAGGSAGVSGVEVFEFWSYRVGHSEIEFGFWSPPWPLEFEIPSFSPWHLESLVLTSQASAAFTFSEKL